jgi:hypothetical protein
MTAIIYKGAKFKNKLEMKIKKQLENTVFGVGLCNRLITGSPK